MSEYEERFDSVSRVYGADVLKLLRDSHVCVIGIGGVGSWAAESLARTGIGAITLIDGDAISRSNVNRQIHTMESSLGHSKAGEMQSRIIDINPDCDCRMIDDYINDENLGELLSTDFSVVIDAIDRIKYKSAVIHHCKRNKIPVITVGGAGGLLDPTKVEVSDLTKTWNDPLSASVRSRLRYKYRFPSNLKRSFGIPCVYSTEQRRYPDKDGNIGYSKPGVKGLSLDCNFGYGSSVAVTATFGFVAAEKSIQIIIKQGRPVK
jgi:tRNA A37 threonylcarbamoyladenosine dehydratase